MMRGGGGEEDFRKASYDRQGGEGRINLENFCMTEGKRMMFENFRMTGGEEEDF